MMTQRIDEQLDLRGTPCPMNWVKLKLKLEGAAAGQVVEVLLDDGDAVLNVPRSAKAEGHRIISIEPHQGGFRLLVERAGAPPTAAANG
jgi:tRNA 2-thiouridine synthesizing protein A